MRRYNCKCPIRHTPEAIMFKGCQNYVDTQEGICDKCYDECAIEKRKEGWVIQ